MMKGFTRDAGARRKDYGKGNHGGTEARRDECVHDDIAGSASVRGNSLNAPGRDSTPLTMTFLFSIDTYSPVYYYIGK
jgi:hypothetical protein